MSFVQRRFKRNVALLLDYFPDVSNMKGIIIKIEVEGPCDNYTRIFGDPALEETLQICGDDNLLLFYKGGDKNVSPKSTIMKGVTVMTSYKFTEKDTLRIPRPPAMLPQPAN